MRFVLASSFAAAVAPDHGRGYLCLLASLTDEVVAIFSGPFHSRRVGSSCYLVDPRGGAATFGFLRFVARAMTALSQNPAATIAGARQVFKPSHVYSRVLFRAPSA